MKIACISDLHLANDGVLNTFQHKEESFLHFLDYLEENYDRIILNGDIYDPCKSFKVNQHEEELLLIQKSYPQLVKRFNQENYIQIAGNHDYILEKYNIPLSYSFKEEDGSLYYFTHGHIFDNLRGHKGNFIYYVISLVNMLEKRILKNAEAYLSWFEERFSSWFNMGSTHLIKEKAMNLFKNIDNPLVLVMGHSHEQANKAEIGNNIYLNSGACVRKRIEYVHIDTNEKDYFTQSWSKTNRFGIAVDTNYFKEMSNVSSSN